MGLNASVACNCVKEGKLKTPPPFPLRMDEDGLWEPDFDWTGNEEKFQLFGKWRQTACDHEDLNYCDERISNWSGLRLFEEALETVGLSRFPTLIAELPNSNDGFSAASIAPKILEELNYFGSLPEIGEVSVLEDAETGDELYQHIRSYDGVFVFDGKAKLRLGVDDRGFFVRKKVLSFEVEIFRSMSFDQTVLESPGIESDDVSVAFRDQRTGKQCQCRSGVHRYFQSADGQDCVTRPTKLRVRKRQRSGADFDYILVPLRRICEASILTGNPIQWR